MSDMKTSKLCAILKIGKFFPLNLPFLAPIYKIWHLVCFLVTPLIALNFCISLLSRLNELTRRLCKEGMGLNIRV